MSAPPIQKKDVAQLHLTLDDVKLAFTRWRQSPNKSWYIPEELWNQVVELLPYYPKKKLISALAIGPAQLEKRLKQSLTPTRPRPFASKKTPSASFVSFVKAITPTPATPPRGHDIVLTRANGATLKVEQLQHNDLIKLIEQFCEISP